MSKEKLKRAGKPRYSTEAEETLEAIRQGAVDAFVIQERGSHQVYTLQGTDLPFSALVEKMQLGAAMLNQQGEILYGNPGLGELIGMSRVSLIGEPFEQFIEPAYRPLLNRQLKRADLESGETEMQLLRTDGRLVPVKLSFQLLTAKRSATGVLIRDITVKKKLAELAARLQEVQDEERRRLARDLHDSVGQLIVAIMLNNAAIQREAGKLSDEAAQLFLRNNEMVNELNDQIRTISHLLHPPLLDEVGLPSALRWYVDGFAERSKIQTTLEIPADFQRLPRETEIAVFRTVQECLTNVHRHSGSSACYVKVACGDRQLLVEVRDEGRGIGEAQLLNLASSGGVGLRGLQERLRQLGGRFDIVSSDNGTVVTAVLPIPPSGTAPSGERVA
jgi:PAS domain S-box-containing protein